MLSSSAVVLRACRRRTLSIAQSYNNRLHSASVRLSSTSPTAVPPTATRRPVRPTNITLEERAAIRAARKERATAALQRAQGGEAAAAGSSTSSSSSSSFLNPKYSRWMWYAGLGLPSIFITWGIYDENSPPAQLVKAVGLADFIGNYTSQISAPVYDKLLPDWADVSNP